MDFIRRNKIKGVNMTVKIKTYNGFKYIELRDINDIFVISFGKRKAEAILDHIEEIKKFVGVK